MPFKRGHQINVGRHHSHEHIATRTFHGKNHPSWRGGKIKRSGYIHIYKPDHHHCNKLGYVPEHRLSYEEYHNCCLLSWVDIHHKDGNRSNNIWYNLIPYTRGAHMRLENSKDYSDYHCHRCGRVSTYIIKKTGKPHWYYLNDKSICSKCFGVMK